MQRYRADIDGLRAVAVLAVVAFHSGFRVVPGGFVGVDVFFVISGYLICGLIEKDIGAGRFSAADFYKRRILRIAPAFTAVLLVTVGLAYAFMLPTELEEFSRSLVAAALSASNIIFAQQSGYFDAPALTKPLLHTWSLGVEEQFYLVFPVLLVALHRWAPQRRTVGIALLAATSLVAAAVCATWFPVEAFYQMPFRFWELALGALGALRAFPAPATPASRNALAATGLAMIVGAVFLVSREAPLTIAILVPCVGALLVILAGERGSSLVGWGLSLRPVVFIGLISYSLYLWHWPIIVFQNSDAFLLPDSGTAPAKLTLIGVCLVVATLSWWLIERPFRLLGRDAPRGRTFAFAAASAAALVGIGLGSLAIEGAAFRFPPEAVRIAAYLAYDPTPFYREGKCFITSYKDFDRSTCLHRDAAKRNILLIGDSHAAHLWWGLSSTFKEVNVMQATASGCKPLVVTRLLEARACRELMDSVFDDVLPHEHIDKLVIAAQWTDDDVPKIAATLDRLQEEGIIPVLVGPIPQYDYSLPRLLADAIRYGDPAYPDEHRVKGLGELDGRLSTLAAVRHVEYISLMDLLCRDGRCEDYATATVPIQFDTGHLTKEGSMLLASRLDRTHAFP